MLSVVSKLTWCMRNEPLVPNKRESRLFYVWTHMPYLVEGYNRAKNSSYAVT